MFFLVNSLIVDVENSALILTLISLLINTSGLQLDSFGLVYEANECVGAARKF